MPDKYDLIVIGAGPGGYVAAVRAASIGKRTAVFEAGTAGGVCLNRGCVPTKTLLHSAELYRSAAEGAAFGVVCDNLRLDYPALLARRDGVVSRLRDGVEQLLKANKIDLIREKAVITGRGEVVAGGVKYSADKILIATGSAPLVPPIPGSGLPGVVTSDALLEGDSPLFDRLVIIGGGVIGVEFASVYAGLGRKVTIIEAAARILPLLDREISQNLTMILKKRGVAVHAGAKVERIEGGGPLVCRFKEGDSEQTVESDGVLIAIGRQPGVAGLFAAGGEDGLGFGGIRMDADKYGIGVNEGFETSVPGIYAVGDVVRGSIRLAHTASAEGVNAVSAMFGEAAPFDLSIVPSCIYTSPEIACAGITADQAKERGIAVKTGKFIMSANGKTVLSGGERGFIKLVFSEEDGVLLGAQLMCERATDMIAELCGAIANRLTHRQLASYMRPHPTFCEAVHEAVENAFGVSIHTPPR